MGRMVVRVGTPGWRMTAGVETIIKPRAMRSFGALLRAAVWGRKLEMAAARASVAHREMATRICEGEENPCWRAAGRWDGPYVKAKSPSGAIRAIAAEGGGGRGPGGVKKECVFRWEGRAAARAKVCFL